MRTEHATLLRPEYYYTAHSMDAHMIFYLACLDRLIKGESTIETTEAAASVIFANGLIMNS